MCGSFTTFSNFQCTKPHTAPGNPSCSRQYLNAFYMFLFSWLEVTLAKLTSTLLNGNVGITVYNISEVYPGERWKGAEGPGGPQQ